MRTAKNVRLYVNGKATTALALFDTGATYNYVRKDVMEKIAAPAPHPKPFAIGLGGKKQTLSQGVTLNVKVGKYEMPSQFFYIAETSKFDAIFGAFFMEKWGISLDPQNKRLKIHKDWFQLTKEF
jgi:hypothetical protein